MINLKAYWLLKSYNEYKIQIGNYVCDITGEINIPNNIKYVKFGYFEGFANKKEYKNYFNNIIDKFKFVNQTGKIIF